VIFEIDLTDGTLSGYCFQMNSTDYTAYPEEDEILLDDGRPFRITNIKSQYKDDQKYIVI